MDKEQLNAKLKEMGKVFSGKKVKDNLGKAKNGIGKAVDGTVNSSFVKKMTPGQKYMILGASAIIVIAIIGLASRLIFTPDPSIWCVAEASKTELAFNVAGKVAEVAYSEKQIANKGATIARLEDEAYIAALGDAEARFAEANLQYLKMENRFTELENTLAEAMLKAAESANEAAIAALELAKAHEGQYRSFLDDGTVSEVHYDASVKAVANAEAEVNRTENALESAKQSFEAMKTGYTPEEIEAAKQEADGAAAQTARAKAALEGIIIAAPFDAYMSKVSIKAGDTVEPGASVFEAINLGEIWLSGFVDKSLAETLKPGHVVRVEFSEIPRENFTGKIVSVASEPQSKEGEAQYEVRMELDNPGNKVLPGMEAVAIATVS